MPVDGWSIEHFCNFQGACCPEWKMERSFASQGIEPTSTEQIKKKAREHNMHRVEQSRRKAVGRQ